MVYVANFTWEEAVFACLCMLAGLFLCFLGLKIFIATVVLAGVFLGYVIMYAILINCDVTNEAALVFGSLAFGIVFGVIMVFMLKKFLKGVLFLIGFLAGFFFAIWILSWASSEGHSIESDAWRWVTIILIAIIGGIITVALPKILIAVGTSMFGSYLVFYGIDIFAQTGYADAFRVILSGDPHLPFDDVMYAMLACNGVLCGLGILVQLCVTGKHSEPKEGYQPLN